MLGALAIGGIALVALTACSGATPSPSRCRSGDPQSAITACETNSADSASWGSQAPVAPDHGRIVRTRYVSASADGPTADGSRAHPFADLQTAVDGLQPGDELVLLAGRYSLATNLRVSVHGLPDAWIRIRGENRDAATLDGEAAGFEVQSTYPNADGLVQIADAAYVVLRDLVVEESPETGVNIQGSHHVDLINVAIDHTRQPGIAAWRGVEYLRVLGCRVARANDPAMDRRHTPPFAVHEAISIAGPRHFEVAFNEVYDSFHEGIDIKETSGAGRVHHNLVHDVGSQGLYVDAWFGVLEDVELDHNVVFDCGHGLAVSVEGAESRVRDIRIHHNLLYDNRGFGMYLSRWGDDGPREALRMDHNTVALNGYGSFPGVHWAGGGLYVHTHQVHSVQITDNLFAYNFPFEVGFVDTYRLPMELGTHDIRFAGNVVWDVSGADGPVAIPRERERAVPYAEAGTPTDPEMIDPLVRELAPRADARHRSGALPRGWVEPMFWQLPFPPSVPERNPSATTTRPR